MSFHFIFIQDVFYQAFFFYFNFLMSGIHLRYIKKNENILILSIINGNMHVFTSIIHGKLFFVFRYYRFNKIVE